MGSVLSTVGSPSGFEAMKAGRGRCSKNAPVELAFRTSWLTRGVGMIGSSRIGRVVAVGAVLLLTVAACGDDDVVSDTAATSTATAELVAEDLPDPCTLVVQEDVDALFGGNPPEANPGMVSGPGGVAGGRSCSWSKIAAVWVSVFVSPDFLTSLERCDYCSPLDGLGYEAWGGESDLGSGGSIVAVVVDGIGVQVRADGLGASVDDLLPLVRSVLGGLPG